MAQKKTHSYKGEFSVIWLYFYESSREAKIEKEKFRFKMEAFKGN